MSKSGSARLETGPRSVDRDGRQDFVTACTRFGLDAEAKLRAEIGEREASIARLSAELRMLSRSLLASRRRLSGLELVSRADIERFERDFDELLALPRVRDVDVDGGHVRIVTDPIDIDHDGKTYRIGTFAIDLDLALLKQIQVRNLSNTSDHDSWDHPHIQAGLPCLGNLGPGCEILLGELQLVPLASILIQFLETYDRVSAYAPIDIWEEIAG